MVLAIPLGMRQALVKFRHIVFLLRLGSSHRGSYFTPGTLKAVLVTLVKPVAYLRVLVKPATIAGVTLCHRFSEPVPRVARGSGKTDRKL
jgi:hypothetical protein